MSHLAKWPAAATAPSYLASPACQSLYYVTYDPPSTSRATEVAPAPTRFGFQDPVSDWLIACSRLQSEPLKCVRCGTRSAPLWRREVTGCYLCNGCNLQERSDDRPLLRPKRRAPVSQQRQSVCATCGTSTTSLWRRSPAGQLVCNACGLYYKLHQMERPPELRKDGIRTRRRKAMTRKKGKQEIHPIRSPAIGVATPTGFQDIPVPVVGCNSELNFLFKLN